MYCWFWRSVRRWELRVIVLWWCPRPAWMLLLLVIPGRLLLLIMLLILIVVLGFFLFLMRRLHRWLGRRLRWRHT